MKKILLFIITFLIFINVKALDLEINSKYAYAYNVTLDKEMYNKNANEEIKVASMTKIMTAIIVIENNEDLDKVITIKDEDLRDIYVYTNVGFQAGHEVTIRELLYGILLRSGSDAVNAAVRITTDTEEEFINLMNEKVKELGLVHTHFSNPIGKDKENYSSAYDIAHIMKYCLKNKDFKEIISTDMHYIERLDIQINGPLYKVDKKYGVDVSMINGSKSGYTGTAKHSLVSYGEKDNITYVVVTDYIDSYKELLLDNQKIYTYFFDNYGYKEYDINFNIDIENGKELKEYNVDIKTKLYLEKDHDESLLNYKYEGTDTITFLNKKGSKLGKVSIYYGEELIDEVDVILNKKIEYQSKVYIWPIILVICIIVFILFAIIKRVIKIKKKVKPIKIENKKIKKVVKNEISNEVGNLIKEENIQEKKLEILKTTINVNLFFDTLKECDKIDKQSLEHDFIDRCFQSINFEDVNELKELYTKLKFYKKDMNENTVKYYNKLFKYCIEEYIDEKNKRT